MADGRSFRLLVIGLLGALIAGIGLNFWLDWRQQTRLDQLDVSVMSPETLQRVEKSVYLVVVDGEAAGTAWVANQECGILVTNAHVAQVFDPKKKMTVKAPYTGTEYEVKSVKPHAGYAAFEQTVNEYGPMPRSEGPLTASTPIPIIPGYDAALLNLTADCSRERPVGLAPALQIADQEELGSIHPGDPIALVGYPAGGAATEGVEQITVLPRALLGTVRAITSFIPAGAADAPVESRQAILNSIPATDGTSGSPTINVHGHVTGVLSYVVGGFLQSGERISTRADVVRELLAGTDFAKTDQAYRPRWQRQLKQFDPLKTWVESYLTRRAKVLARIKGKGASIRSITRFDARLGEMDVFPEISFRTKDGLEVKVTPIEEYGQFQRLELALDPALNHLLLVASYNFNCSGNFWPMSFAFRNVASKKFTVVPTQRRPMQAFPARSSKSGKYDVFFARPYSAYCESKDPSFSYYVASWEEGDRVSALDRAQGLLDDFAKNAKGLLDRALGFLTPRRTQPDINRQTEPGEPGIF